MPKTVFISWSGQRSGDVANALRQGLEEIFKPKYLQVWLSAVDMKPGDRWLAEISDTLKKATFGILCLTPENLAQPWIHFEAGAISKAVGDPTSVCPYLYEVDVSALNKSPLGQFQAVKSNNKEANKKLVASLHAHLDEEIYPPKALEATFNEVFNEVWLQLEKSLSNIPPLTAVQPSELSDRKILEEILKSVRGADVRGADVRRNLEELGKREEDRCLRRDELTTAMSSVIMWVFDELNLTYNPRSKSKVDFEIVIHEQKVLIETKIGIEEDLRSEQSQNYLRAALDQIKGAREKEGYGNASAIIVIPDYPDVAGQLNDNQYLAGLLELSREQYLTNLLFCKITNLKKHLSDMLAKVPTSSDSRA
jgi:hypothetical protein